MLPCHCHQKSKLKGLTFLFIFSVLTILTYFLYLTQSTYKSFVLNSQKPSNVKKIFDHRLNAKHLEPIMLPDPVFNKLVAESNFSPEVEENKNEENLNVLHREPDEEKPLQRWLNGSFVPKNYLLDREAYGKYKSYLYQKEDLIPEQTRAVIILTNYRSGSSFFGQLFNQHPDAFYFFEPLYPFSHSQNCINTAEKTQVLSDMVRCRLPNWREILKGIPPDQRMKKTSHLARCIMKHVCFRDSTKELCEERHCPRSRVHSEFNCMNHCGIVNTDLASNECRRKKLVAMKIIRYCDILKLKEIFENSNVDIKVLHLIRDPRGTANSRQMLNRRMNLKASMEETCQRQAHNVYSAAVNTPDWLKGRYKLFRYEDVATSPYETARSIYDFVGLSFPESMKEWIASNTAIEYTNQDTEETMETIEATTMDEHKVKRELGFDTVKEKLQKQQIVQIDKKRRQRRNPYGTQRNSTAIVQKWVNRMPYITVRQIESVCTKMMKMMGYVNVGTVDQYRERSPSIKYFLSKDHILQSIN